MDRRSFLKQAVGCAAAGVPFAAFLERRARTEAAGVTRRVFERGYGPLVPAADETTGLPLLKLPEGFTYRSFGWTGDRMTNGRPTPPLHDGMAAFPAGPDRVRLVRNHEIGAGTPFSDQQYDRAAGGGTTTLEFDTARGEIIATHGSLSGTLRNCAGGPTPWGTWLTCEETTESGRSPHGFIFEVPPEGAASPQPLRDMGRFSHEAVAVDPATGYVYETEDAGRRSGFYRFVPHERGALARGGRLSMMKVRRLNQADLGASYKDGVTFDVEWVPIARPFSPLAAAPGDFVWAQGRRDGAATFARLEGCWYANDRRIYVVSTTGGIGHGQIWEYDPAAETIRLLFQSPGRHVLHMPDNITVSPRGGLVVCEDGGDGDRLHGLSVDGQLFPFAENHVLLRGERNGLRGDYRHSEWAGACYSPDGAWLFVNLQAPGITFAIRGPWDEGAL